MSPEQKAQLRYLLRKQQQVPQPASDLLARVSKRFSRFAEKPMGIEAQAKKQEKNKK